MVLEHFPYVLVCEMVKLNGGDILTEEEYEMFCDDYDLEELVDFDALLIEVMKIIQEHYVNTSETSSSCSSSSSQPEESSDNNDS